MATKFVGVRMSDSLVQRVDAIAAARGFTRSKMIEDLVSEALSEEERAVSMMTNPVISQAILGAIARPEVLRAMSESMRHELTDEQLELFTKSMHGLEQQIVKHQPQSSKRVRVSPGKRRKR